MNKKLVAFIILTMIIGSAFMQHHINQSNQAENRNNICSLKSSQKHVTSDLSYFQKGALYLAVAGLLFIVWEILNRGEPKREGL